MAINLTGITWITTYNCNAHCNHCFFDVKEKTQYMNPDIVDLVYSNFTLPRQMFWNHMSGGEVLLQKDVFFEIVKRIRKYFSGSIGISTNGFWAKDKQVAKQIVVEAIDAGITGIAVSTDHYHEPYIPLQYVENAIEAVEASGLKTHCYIMGARSGDAVEDNEIINKHSEDLALQVKGTKQIPLAPTTIRSIGKGAALNVPKQGIPAGACTDLSECLGKRDPFNPAMVWIDAYGNVMICYGITIGNVKKTPFYQIISDYSVESNLITTIIREEGPFGLHLLSEQMGLEPPKHYFDECDVCYQNRKLLRKEFPDILEPNECYP